MRYGSVCSGIEAASVAWDPLGWTAAFFAEIEKFPSAVLSHRFPNVPNHGDFTTINGDEYGAVDLLVGGTPCQDFSIAGLRAGLAGKRGQLTIEFARLAGRLCPRWLVWENVSGVLSADGGRAFGLFLGTLAKLGYGFAYRVLDAQYFGVPQRRRRVFLVGYLGDWRPPAAVLFESESVRGNPAPGRASREDIAPTITARTSGGGGLGSDAEIDGALVVMAHGQANAEVLEGQCPALNCNEDGTGRGLPLVTFNAREDTCWSESVFGALGSSHPQAQAITEPQRVRRITPLEAERLQGFPDGWTLIPWRRGLAADEPRYRALGNSMAVPCMRWIGGRINQVEEILRDRRLDERTSPRSDEGTRVASLAGSADCQP